VRAYGAGGVPGADDGLGAEDVRDEVAADPRVLHLERHVELRPAVPRLRGGAALARLPAAARRPAARRLGAEAVDALGPRRPHGYQHKRGSSTLAQGGGAGEGGGFNGGRPFGLGRMQPGERWEWCRGARGLGVRKERQRAGPGAEGISRWGPPASVGLRGAAAAGPPRLRGVPTGCPRLPAFLFSFFLRGSCSRKFLAGFSKRKKVLFIMLLYESDSGAL